MKDLNVRSETLILLQENTGGKLLDISLGNNILDIIPKLQTTKEKMNSDFKKRGKKINFQG